MRGINNTGTSLQRGLKARRYDGGAEDCATLRERASAASDHLANTIRSSLDGDEPIAS